jgi:hypothetical protein
MPCMTEGFNPRLWRQSGHTTALLDTRRGYGIRRPRCGEATDYESR